MDLIDELLIGEAPALRRVKEMIRLIAPTDVPVMIEGESGTGKELVALALHHGSGREGPFVPVNVCAIADSMFEDTFFGHGKWAFTGAQATARGYLAEADRGTLFLDELAGLAGKHQMKLLRAVETRQFRALGAAADARSDFRLVSASNESVTRLVQQNVLRLDLAHRLNGVLLQLPPLRARKSDVRMLAECFLVSVQRADGRRPTLAASALAALKTHAWPGNVRELRQIVESAAIISHDGLIDGGLVTELLGSNGTRGTRACSDGAFEHARETLVAALAAAGGNAEHAARLIGASRATVYRLARSHGVAIGDFRTRLVSDAARSIPVR